MSVSNFYNFNINLVENFFVSHAKHQIILENLIFMSTFEELSSWVERHTNGQKFIACPANSSREDRESCLNHIQELVLKAIKGKNKRKDGRDLKLANAALCGDYYTIASILASAAWSYWQTYNILNNGDFIFCAKNFEKNQQKIDFQRAQIKHIGAALSFEKARKKGALQEVLDFFETEEIFKNLDFED